MASVKAVNTSEEKERLVVAVTNLLQNWASNDKYGSIEIMFEKGRIVHALKKESLKPGINF